MSEFKKELNTALMSSVKNNYVIEPIPFVSSALQYVPHKVTFKHIRRELKAKVKSIFKITPQAKIKSELKKYDIAGLSSTYDLLNDEYSKELFVILMAHRILGPRKVKLPLQDESAWLPILEIEKKCKREGEYKSKHWTLDLWDLNPIGHNIKYFLKAEGILLSYYLKQYDYDKHGVGFKVDKDDYVVDGGACFGDTAMQFAEAVGENGKVFSFEFIQDNIALFNKNLSFNPELKERVQLLENALWSRSGEKLYVVEGGAASFVSAKKPKRYTHKIQTKTIDDFVEEYNLPKINFIKLDIEGAELECLKGSRNTIKRFKPKLAVCLYHDINHFVSIPHFIKGLVPEYKIYIDHHSANLGETVLYAISSGS